MDDNHWNDDKIEQLLHSMPKVKDDRPASEILERLKTDSRLKESKRRKKHNWIPAIVTIAALIMVSLIVPSMLKNSTDTAVESYPESKMSQKDSRALENSTEESESEADSAAFDEPNISTFSTADMAISHIVLEDEMEGMKMLPLGLVHEANVIPVSILIPTQNVKGEPDLVALYNQFAPKIDEEAYGFDDYHPYKGTISEADGTIIHEVPEDHQYDMSPAAVGVYENSAKATFGNYNEWKVVDEKNSPVVFEYVGQFEQFALKRHSPYFKYIMPTGQEYLVPHENGDESSVSAALLSMKKAENEIVEEIVPETVHYTVEESKGIVTIQFTEPLDLSTLAPNEALNMIEGFMLTASSFDMSVQLQNVVQDQFDKYDLTKALPMPVGVNPILYTE